MTTLNPQVCSNREASAGCPFLSLRLGGSSSLGFVVELPSRSGQSVSAGKTLSKPANVPKRLATSARTARSAHTTAIWGLLGLSLGTQQPARRSKQMSNACLTGSSIPKGSLLCVLPLPTSLPHPLGVGLVLLHEPGVGQDRAHFLP